MPLLVTIQARQGYLSYTLTAEYVLGVQDDQSVPASVPASMHEDHLEREGRVEVASSSSAAASTCGSISTASGGPDHLDSRHWSFQPPNLILDTHACKVTSPTPAFTVVLLHALNCDAKCHDKQHNQGLDSVHTVETVSKEAVTHRTCLLYSTGQRPAHTSAPPADCHHHCMATVLHQLCPCGGRCRYPRPKG